MTPPSSQPTREIRTFVLRLLVDADEPDALRGVLRTVVGDEEESFSDERTLLELLHRLGRPAEAPPTNPAADVLFPLTDPPNCSGSKP